MGVRIQVSGANYVLMFCAVMHYSSLLVFLKQDFTKEDFEYLVEDWETKIVRCSNEDQKWGLFHAKKSA